MNPNQTRLYRCLALLLLLSIFHTTANSQDKKAQIHTLLADAHNLGLFNGNVLVQQSGTVVYQGSFGQADATGKVKLTKDYRFNIGSIAKEFNAVAIIMLQEQGKLNLDDPISRFLPELPSWAEQIKVRHLLQYTSGIPNSKWNEIHGDSDNLNYLKTVTKLDFEPGSQYAYNNNNVFLQRQIVSRITGMPFNDFVNTRMLKPLGIKHAIIDPDASAPLVAHAYDQSGKEDDLRPPFSGWTNLNLQDFLTWSDALNRFKLISPESTRSLLIPFAPGNQTGLGRGEMAGTQLISHTHDGTARNYQALLISKQDKGLTVILQTNNQQNNLTPISRAIEAILENKPYAKIKKSFLKTYGAQIAQMDAGQIRSLYEQAKAKESEAFSFDSEDLLNDVGYALMGQKKFSDALEILKYNTQLFPNSANVFDSLGEAYYRAGKKPEALANYQTALSLDPNLESARKMIAELNR
jgi:CubicO group peptidase (beta-lactamase class C family)